MENETLRKIFCIGSAIVKNIGERYAKAHNNIMESMVSISPVSFVHINCSTNIVIDKVNSEAYEYDWHKSVFTTLETEQPDVIMLDLLDCRLPVNKLLIDNNEVTITDNNGWRKATEKMDLEIVSVVDPFKLSENEWKKIFNKYISLLRESCPNSKVIVLDVRCAMKCLENNKFRDLYSRERQVRLLEFFDKIYKCFRSQSDDIMYVENLGIYYNDFRTLNRAFSYSLQKEYYEYAFKCVDTLINCERSSNVTSTLQNFQIEYYKRTLDAVANTEGSVFTFEKIVKHSFKGIYTDKYNNKVDTKGAVINLVINGENNEVIIGENCKLDNLTIELGDNCKFKTGDSNTIGKDSYIKLSDKDTFILGDNNDFRNAFKVNLYGETKLEIKNENSMYGALNITCWKKAQIYIGSRNLLPSQDSEIRAHAFTSLRICNDTLWSQKIKAIIGDGHSIFDVKTGKKLNDAAELVIDKNSIIVNNHVWVGYGVLLLAGTNIGEGSIVGANSLTNKTFPNNCIIAGTPARIIKKDIAWCRDNFCNDIEKCKPYAKLTNDSDL